MLGDSGGWVAEPTVVVAFVAAIAVGLSAWLGRRSATTDQSVTVNVNGLLDRIACLEAKVIDLERTVTSVRSQEASHLARLLSAERRIRMLEEFIRSEGYDLRLIADSGVPDWISNPDGLADGHVTDERDM